MWGTIADKVVRRQDETLARPTRPVDLNTYEYKVARFTRGFSDPSGQAVIAQRLGLTGMEIGPSQRSGAEAAQGSRPGGARILVGGVAVAAQGSRPNSSQRGGETESRGGREQGDSATPARPYAPQRQGTPVPF